MTGLVSVSFGEIVGVALSVSEGAGVLLAVALLVLVGAYDVLGAADRDVRHLRRALLAAIIPLSVTFAVILLAKSIAAY